MKKNIIISLILIFAVCFCLSNESFARAGGGGGSGGGGGGGGGGSHSHHSSSNRNVTGKESLVRIILHTSVMAVLGAGGTIALIYYSRKAKRNSIRLMKSYQKLGVNWDYKEVQKYVEDAYFIIQEAWRRYDTSYAAGYLSEELEIEWNAKLQWMQIRNEEIVQKRVRLISAVPVGVHDEAGEDKDQIWYLIHGKMLGYYRDRETKRHIRGDLQDKAFFEYWLFVRRNGRWVLHQIRQKNEMDIQEFL